MNLCVAVVFYMHVYTFLLLQIVMVFYFLHLILMNLMSHITLTFYIFPSNYFISLLIQTSDFKTLLITLVKNF